jgi:hypothetical protein
MIKYPKVQIVQRNKSGLFIRKWPNMVLLTSTFKLDTREVVEACYAKNRELKGFYWDFAL